MNNEFPGFIESNRARMTANGSIDSKRHYRILVSAFPERPQARAYQFGIRDAIPDIPIPLRPSELDKLLPLNHLLHALYDRGGYDLAIDYTEQSTPPLTAEETAWLQQLMA